MRVFTDSTSDDNKRPHDEASKHRGHKRRRKRSYSLERNVETLVVADGKMTEFYKNENIETYILTIMNMVNWWIHEFISALNNFSIKSIGKIFLNVFFVKISILNNLIKQVATIVMIHKY